MAEGAGGEKTEKATPKRREDARKKGQVLKSVEVATAISLIAMFAVLKLVGSYLSDRTGNFLQGYLSGAKIVNNGAFGAGEVTAVMTDAVVNIIMILGPVLAAAMLIGVVTNVMQFGFLFSTKALAPKFSKMNPIEGFKRMFSSRTLFELGKSIIKIILIVWLFQDEYRKLFGEFSTMMVVGIAEGAGELFENIFSVAFKICAALLIFSVFDYLYQYWKFEKDMMMTKYEIKMEYKQQEGDPQIKSRIRQKQREMAMLRMMQSVPEADVVITNPTHFAVALKYDEKSEGAPVVTAKGQDHVALKIKEKAKEAGVEIVEDKPLARALYQYCDIGMEIPVELYGAVADILAYVYKLKNKHGGRR